MNKKQLQELSGPLNEALFQEEGPGERAGDLLQFLNCIPESILIIDANTKVCFVNERYLRMFGISKERILGRYLAKFEPLARIHEVLKTGQVLTGDISHIHSAGLDVYADIVPLFYQGKTTGALAMMKNVTELVSANRAMEHFRSLSQCLRNELNSKEDLPQPFRNVLGQNRTFLQMLHIAARAASSDVNVCISGESGVGKEVVAEAIHSSSPRANEPLIKINCAAIPENLLESELFGYESGAFTGARAGGKIGKFEAARGGTVFLDEIGEMPLSMQVKLLRVLQEREVTRVGGIKTIKLDFRLITATNRDLHAMVKEGVFREDLYYRINVIGLVIPPLRARPDDILVYAQLFLDEFSTQYAKRFFLSPEVEEILRHYAWPGNIRELKNCIERAVILCAGEEILPEVLPSKVLAGNPNSVNFRPEDYRLAQLLERTEREAIETVLQLTGNNKTQAMEILGISRRNFYQKLEKYGIS